MRKLFLGMTLVLLLAACGDNDTTDKKENTGANEESSIEVDKGLLNVEITIPADFLGEQTEEEIRADAEKQGVKEVTFNDDGSVTYKMSKAEHEKVLKQMGEELDKSLEELVTSGDFPSIQKATANKDYTEFDLTVNRAQFEEGMDSFAVLGLMLGSSYYQLFEGKSEGEAKLTVNYIDAETGETFETEEIPGDEETTQ